MDVVSDVCARFQNMGGPKRVELMCSLLRMCLPLELRFIGTCVEDIAKKDFFYLREDENKANDRTVLQSLKDIYDNITRCKLNIYLSLLNSSNTPCSGVLFSTLTCFDHELPNLSNEFLDEVLLLLTLAANHPAFTFNQRQILNDKLKCVSKKCDDRKPKVSPGPHPPASGSVTVNHVLAHQTKPQQPVIQDITLAGAQLRAADRKYEFHVQVTWSDDDVTDVYTTYQELQSFHSQLVHLFPKESGAHRQDRLMPFFPQEKSHPPNQMEDQIREYIKRLSALPDYILHDAHVVSFMRTPWRQRITSPRSHSATAPSSQSAGGRYPAAKPGVPVGPLPHSVNFSKSVNHDLEATSPMSTPRQSPMVSPRVSPAMSPNSFHNSPNSSNFHLGYWLKEMRLHKYEEPLSKYTKEQLLSLTDQDLEDEGLTQGARRKLRQHLEKSTTSSANGLQFANDYAGSVFSESPSSPPSTWQPPTCASGMSYMQPSMILFSSQSNNSLDSSRASSEYSSPAVSPGPQDRRHLTASSSSDDNEQDVDQLLSTEMKTLDLCGPHDTVDAKAASTPQRTAVPPGTPILALPSAPSTGLLLSGLEVRPGDMPPVHYLPGQRLPHPSFPMYPQHMMARYHLPPHPPPPVIRPPLKVPNGSNSHVLCGDAPHHSIENGLPAYKPSDTPGVSHPHQAPVQALSFMTCSVVSGGSPVPLMSRPSSLSLPPGSSASTAEDSSSIDSVANMGSVLVVDSESREGCVASSVANSGNTPVVHAESIAYGNFPPGLSIMSSAPTSSSLVGSTGYRTPPPPQGYQTPPPPHATGYQTPPMPAGYQTPPPPPVTGYQTPPAVPTSQGYAVSTSQPGPGPVPGVAPMMVPPGPVLTTQSVSMPAPGSPAMPPGIPSHQPTPTSTPTPSAPSMPVCSSCGCHCAAVSRSSSVPAPYYPHWAHMLFQGPPLGLVPTSNGLVNPPLHGLPYAVHQNAGPPPNMPNGITPELFYQNQANYAHLQALSHPPGLPTGPGILAYHMPSAAPSGPHSGPASNGSSSSSTTSNSSCKVKNGVASMCCNCGSAGHVISECKEPTFDTIGGQYHLNIHPKPVETE